MKYLRLLTLALLCLSSTAAQTFPDASSLLKPSFPAVPGAAQVVHIDATAAKLDTRLLHFGVTDAGLRKSAAPLLSSGLLPVEWIGGRMLLPVFVLCNGNPDEAAAAIRAAGGDAGTRAGDVLLARVPADALRAVASSRAVRAIQASSFLNPLLNESRREIRADAVHAGTNLPQAYSGQGVVVGVVDSGIDWAHPDFSTRNGSRIQYLWDMSDSVSTVASPPVEYGYGREYTRAALEAGIALERDLPDGFGHGTHVTGTAAGNGNANAEYTGIAPKADIIFVKGFRSGPGFKDTDVINGCDWIFKRAAALGMPAVINLSLGGHAGPHDGSTLYERSLDALTGPGRIIVAAAGNEGDRRMHVRYTTGGSDDEPRVTFFRVQQGAPLAAIDIWYSGGPVNVGLAWYDPYPTLLGHTAAVPAGGAMNLSPVTIGGPVPGFYSLANIASDPVNGLGHAEIILLNNTQSPIMLEDVVFALYTHGSGTLDAWFVRGGEFGPTRHDDYHIIPGDYRSSVGTPGTAKRLITVGSYVTKNTWTDVNGTTQTQDGNPTVGDLSSFSSSGPTRDGRLKPEISAPGEAILSALSADCGAPDASVLFGGRYQKMQGTSMASPHVTGTVALMLEKNSALDVDDVRNTLITTARTDAFTGAVPNVQFGHGKLDAFAAVQRTTPRKSRTAPPASFSVTVYPNPTAGNTVLSYTLPHAADLRLRITDALGRTVAQRELLSQTEGTYRLPLTIDAVPAGVYFYTLQAGESVQSGRIVRTP
ncbi:MAG: S8 family peptidase [Ignavibacteriae bacterium]|nr:S8 family peptidase [Ignavibacteriota bacterium]